MIGAKSLGTGLLLLAGLAVAIGAGVLRPERLLALRADAFLVSGTLAVVMGMLLYRFWRLGERSARYFRFSTDPTGWSDEAHFLGSSRVRLVMGENDGEAFDFRPATQLLICLALGVLLGLGTIGERALGLLVEFPQQLTAAGSTYCPEPGEEKVASAADDPTAPGCALIRRAYQLGYAKTLGDCAPKTAKETGAEPCTLRQRDEPYLHYAWRLVGQFQARMEETTRGGYFAGLKKDFDQKTERLEELYAAKSQLLKNAPHASHHVWTNLPDPGGAFDPLTCTDRYRELPHRPPSGENAASRVFEHVLAQLLFEGRYEPAAGYCREFQVHWGAPPDACKRLAADPEAFLTGSGAIDGVRSTLLRARLAGENTTATEPGESAKATPRPQAYLSFQCYLEGTGARDETLALTFEGERFEVTVRAAPDAGQRSLHVEHYRRIASLLAPSFRYGALMSEAGLTSQDASEALTRAFAGDDFLLSRARALQTVDVFLEPEWLAARPDLLEIYPYHLHLKNYVQLFRRQYRLIRGRL